MNTRMSSYFRFVVFTLWLVLLSKTAFADTKKPDSIKKFYSKHGLGFLGDLVTDQKDFGDDEKKRAKIELLADDARVRALTQLENLLRRADKAMEAELLLRKATLLSDRARTASYFQNNPFKTARIKDPKFYLEESIKTFQVIEKRFGTHPKMDVVTFSIAYNYGELRQISQSFQYYQRLINKFPDSALVGDARFALAEIYFDKREFKESLNQLRLIVKSEHPRLKNFALYKMAWTYYNMSDLDSSIASLEKVIDGVNKISSEQTSEQSRLELRKEAINDLVYFYAEKPSSTAPAESIGYFEQIAKTPDSILKQYEHARAKRLAAYAAKKVAIPDEEHESYLTSESNEALLKLVQVYRDQGKHEALLSLTEKLVTRMASHPKVAALFRLRAESAEKLRRRDQLLEELKRFAEVVERDLPSVSKYKDGLPESELNVDRTDKTFKKPTVKEPIAINESELRLERNPYQKNLANIAFSTFKDFAFFLHGEWSKTKSADTANQALKVYDLAIHLMFEPWRGQPLEQAFEIRFQRAGLRHALDKMDLSAQDFNWLAKHYSSIRNATGVNKQHLESLRGEIASLETLIKEHPITVESGKKLHPTHQRLISAYDLFLAYHLQNVELKKEVSSILSASARLYKEYGEEKDALDRISYYVKNFPDQKDAEALIRDALALLEKKSRWQDLKLFSKEILDTGHYKTASIQPELTRSYEYASLRLIEDLETEKNWKDASKEFAKFAKENVNSSFTSQALLKSANAALQLKDTSLALERLETAAKATDERVRVQAWLSLEPFYRKAFQWNKLLTIYESLLHAKPQTDLLNAKVLQGITENLNEIKKLRAQSYKGMTYREDKELASFNSKTDAFKAELSAFESIRFLKSNNNPAKNFKQKADAHAKLVSKLDQFISNASSEIKASALIWANTTKAELLLEFATTLEKAALPAALAQSSETDKKAYTEAIQAQATQLKVQAKALLTEIATTASKSELPFNLEEKINPLFMAVQIQQKLTRANFIEIWKARPKTKYLKSVDSTFVGEIAQKKLDDIAHRILDAEKSEEARPEIFKLAQTYLEMGEPGYASALIEQLSSSNGSPNDEWKEKAVRLRFELEASHLPQALAVGIEHNEWTPQTRWGLAVWMTRFGLAKTGFSEDELKWFGQATQSLLKPQLKVEQPLTDSKLSSL